MHDRNIYKVFPDFEELAKAYPPLYAHLLSAASPGSRKTIDFKNEASQRCLTQALLHRDFGLAITLPDDRLCPPVPNRLNYILWIQDILLAQPGPSQPTAIRGIDIGTGASSIYPLLGCKLDPSWTFLATELDERSLQYAQANVSQNHLGHRIRLVQAKAEDTILPLDACVDEQFDFTMCNPPFYSSMEDVERSADGKALQPNAVCTGAPVEMVTCGGEAGFVIRMVRESAQAKLWCRWYTSMLGMMASLTQVVGVLKELDITNYAITEFVQGQTRRWAIGWSFTKERLPDSISRIPNPALRSLMPLHNTVRQPIPAAVNISAILANIEGIGILRNDGLTLITAKADTWSRSARRNRKRREAQAEEGEVALVCTATVQRDEEIVYQWVRGEDRGMFDSFCSHVSRKALARQ
ncbi:S-adenosyl-L-methionine dependent methyltransferase [Hymenopellis radicata]|nr:S-adenosyl-L-methionine dependent methyltransferase [Hymenopellis radicata]